MIAHPKEGMRQGIVESGAVIIFLSAGILSRPFCTFVYLLLCALKSVIPLVLGQFEIRVALSLKKTVILIRESLNTLRPPAACLTAPIHPDEADPRHGAYDFYAEQLEAPEVRLLEYRLLPLKAAVHRSGPSPPYRRKRIDGLQAARL